MTNVTPTALIGCIPEPVPAAYLAFGKWLGRKPYFALMAFNQYNPSALASSVLWACQQAKAMIADGAHILWSVPAPGGKQLEAIVAGTHDALYRNLFQSIVAVTPAADTHIHLRLLWEFNLMWQENAAINKAGVIDTALFIKAWQHLASLAKAVSPRFYRIWCPAVSVNAVDPALCWPGGDFVEYVSQDWYMQKSWCKAGDFHRFRDNVRGLQWAADFAHQHGKRYGLSEWGMDSDIFVPDLNAAATWLGSLGLALDHHLWWDRAEVIDCRVSDGTHPGLAAAYKAHFT